MILWLICFKLINVVSINAVDIFTALIFTSNALLAELYIHIHELCIYMNINKQYGSLLAHGSLHVVKIIVKAFFPELSYETMPYCIMIWTMMMMVVVL